jgi:hypothetical protein
MENHSESLIEIESDSRDSRSGDALLLKHLSDAKSLETKSPLQFHQMTKLSTKGERPLFVRKITSMHLQNSK